MSAQEILQCGACQEFDYRDNMGFSDGGDGPFCHEGCIDRVNLREAIELGDEE